jgi:hypothetical protein
MARPKAFDVDMYTPFTSESGNPGAR